PGTPSDWLRKLDGSALRAVALALLRPLRHGRYAAPRAGQFPGRSITRRRDAHVADQYRAAVARHCQRVRPRLFVVWCDDRAVGIGVSDVGENASIQGAFL